MDMYEIRRKKLHELIAQYEGPARLARRLRHKGTSYLSQLSTGHRPVTEKTAREIEKEPRLPHLWFDGGGAPPPAVPQAPQAGTIDAERLSHAVRSIQQAVLADKLMLAPAAFADAVVFVYQESLRGHAVDVGALLRLLNR